MTLDIKQLARELGVSNKRARSWAWNGFIKSGDVVPLSRRTFDLAQVKEQLVQAEKQWQRNKSGELTSEVVDEIRDGKASSDNRQAAFCTH